MKSDTPKASQVSSINPYSGLSSSSTYSQSPSQDGAPVVMTIIGSVIAIALVMGCIGLMDTEEEDDYYSSSSSSGSSSSTPCEQLKDVWCYSYSLDMCVYHDSSSNVVYYQEANWYGCWGCVNSYLNFYYSSISPFIPHSGHSTSCIPGMSGMCIVAEQFFR